MESSISQSNISIGFNTLPKPTKRILDVNDPFSDGRVKLSVNLFSIKIKEEYAKKVYLFGVDAKEVYPKTNERKWKKSLQLHFFDDRRFFAGLQVGKI